MGGVFGRDFFIAMLFFTYTKIMHWFSTWCVSWNRKKSLLVVLCRWVVICEVSVLLNILHSSLHFGIGPSWTIWRNITKRAHSSQLGQLGLCPHIQPKLPDWSFKLWGQSCCFISSSVCMQFFTWYVINLPF